MNAQTQTETPIHMRVEEKPDSPVVVKHNESTPVWPSLPAENPFLSLLREVLTNPNVGTDKIQMLYEWKKEQDARNDALAKEQAERDFIAAKVKFKLAVPQILKDKHVEFDTSKGVTAYDHATIGAVCDAVIPALAQHGLDHSWQVIQEPGKITVICQLKHVGGHAETVTLWGPPDTSGTKNAIQANESTVTYLSRYSLLAVCGVATKGMPDNDGRGAPNGDPKPEPPPPQYPEGYEDWRADLRAAADNGLGPLKEVWEDRKPTPEVPEPPSKKAFRRYMFDNEPRTWEQLKKKAEGADKAVLR